MTNKHASKQHGITTHKITRPKSKLTNRNNKHKSVAKKSKIIEQRLAAKKTRNTSKPLTSSPMVVKKKAIKKVAKKPLKKVAKKPVKKVAKKVAKKTAKKGKK